SLLFALTFSFFLACVFSFYSACFFFFQAEDGIRDRNVTGVQTCALSISVFAAGIIAEIGQIERFEDETKIAKYAGLYWRKHQSGRFTAEDTSLTRNGNQYLRYYLVEAANSVRRHVPEYKDYYAKKY